MAKIRSQLSTDEIVKKYFCCASQALDDAGWAVAHQSSSGSISTCPAPCRTGSLVRVKFSVDCAEDPNKSFVRPEVIASHPNLSNLGSMVSYLGLVQLIEPGHALVWRRYGERNKNSYVYVRELLLGEPEHLKHVGQELQSLEDVHMARIVQRRDFPEPGVMSMYVAPEFEGSRSPPGVSCLWIAKRKTIDGVNINVLEMTQLLYQPVETFSSWTLPFFDKMLLSGIQFIGTMFNSPTMRAMRVIDDSFYLVLNLKRCTYGPPLLPAPCEASAHVSVDIGIQKGLNHWVHYPRPTFKLAEYLQAFLACIGFSDVLVFSDLDGRRLVPYQAVMLREAWEAMQEVFRPAFDIQQAAYRRIHKGKAAPEFNFGREARFMPPEEENSTSESCAVPQRVDLPMKIAIHNTFIEVQDDASDDTPPLLPRRAMEA